MGWLFKSKKEKDEENFRRGYDMAVARILAGVDLQTFEDESNHFNVDSQYDFGIFKAITDFQRYNKGRKPVVPTVISEYRQGINFDTTEFHDLFYDFSCNKGMGTLTGTYEIPWEYVIDLTLKLREIEPIKQKSENFFGR